MRGHSIVLPCGHCNAEFRTYTSRLNEGHGKFCSRTCSWAGRKTTALPLAVHLARGVVKDVDGCWRRTIDVNPVSGYSTIRKVGAHRVALERRLGFKIPSSFMSLHACDVRSCIRNDEPGIYVIRGIARPRFGHLWLGTQADNMADMIAKGRRHTPVKIPLSH